MVTSLEFGGYQNFGHLSILDRFVLTEGKMQIRLLKNGYQIIFVLYSCFPAIDYTSLTEIFLGGPTLNKLGFF